MTFWDKVAGGREDGFTLIELLFAISIISILASMSWGAFYVYKSDAEYTKAQAAIANSQRNIIAGILDLPDDVTIGYETTGLAGGPVPVAMQDMLPGGVSPKDVILGASIDSCGGERNPAMINLTLVAQPCKSDREVRWFQFCDGQQIMQEDLALAAACP